MIFQEQVYDLPLQSLEADNLWALLHRREEYKTFACKTKDLYYILSKVCSANTKMYNAKIHKHVRKNSTKMDLAVLGLLLDLMLLGVFSKLYDSKFICKKLI